MLKTLIGWDSPFVILILLLAFFGVLALIVWAIRKFVPGVDPDRKEKIDPDVALEEELDRVLVPFDENEHGATTPSEPSVEESDEHNEHTEQ